MTINKWSLKCASWYRGIKYEKSTAMKRIWLIEFVIVKGLKKKIIYDDQ